MTEQERLQKQREDMLLALDERIQAHLDYAENEIRFMERLEHRYDVAYPSLREMLSTEEYEANGSEGISWRRSGNAIYEMPRSVSYHNYVNARFDRYKEQVESLWRQFDPELFKTLWFSMPYLFGKTNKAEIPGSTKTVEVKPFPYLLGRKNDEAVLKVFGPLPSGRSPAKIYWTLSAYVYPLTAAFHEMVPPESRDEADQPVYPGRKYVPWPFNIDELTSYIQAFGRFLAYCELPMSYAPAKNLIGRYNPAEIDKMFEIMSALHGEDVARGLRGQSSGDTESGWTYVPGMHIESVAADPQDLFAGYEKVPEELKQAFFKPQFDLSFLMDPAKWRYGRFAYLLSDHMFDTLVFKFCRQANNAYELGILPTTGEHWARVVGIWNALDAYLPPRPTGPAAEKYSAWQSLALMMLFILPDHDYAYSVFFQEYFKAKLDLEADLLARVKILFNKHREKDNDEEHNAQMDEDIQRVSTKKIVDGKETLVYDLSQAVWLLEKHYPAAYDGVNKIVLDMFGFFYQEAVRPFPEVLKEAGILLKSEDIHIFQAIRNLFLKKYDATALPQDAEKAIRKDFYRYIFEPLAKRTYMSEEEAFVTESYRDSDGGGEVKSASRTPVRVMRLIRRTDEEFAEAQGRAGLKSKYLSMRKLKDITQEEWEKASREVTDAFIKVGTIIRNPEKDPKYGDTVITSFILPTELEFDANEALKRIGRRIYNFGHGRSESYWVILKEGATDLSFTLRSYSRGVMKRAMDAADAAVDEVESGAGSEDYDEMEGESTEDPEKEALEVEPAQQITKELPVQTIWEGNELVTYIYGRKIVPRPRADDEKKEAGPVTLAQRLDIIVEKHPKIMPQFLIDYRDKNGFKTFEEMPLFLNNKEFWEYPLGTRIRWVADATVPLPTKPVCLYHALDVLRRDYTDEFNALYGFLTDKKEAPEFVKRELSLPEYTLKLWESFRKNDLLPTSAYVYMNKYNFESWLLMGMMVDKKRMTLKELDALRPEDRELVLQRNYEGPEPSLLDYFTTVPENELPVYNVILGNRDMVLETIGEIKKTLPEVAPGSEESFEIAGKAISWVHDTIRKQLEAVKQSNEEFDAWLAQERAKNKPAMVEYRPTYVGPGKGDLERRQITPKLNEKTGRATKTLEFELDGKTYTYKLLEKPHVAMGPGGRIQVEPRYYYIDEQGNLKAGQVVTFFLPKEGGDWKWVKKTSTRRIRRRLWTRDLRKIQLRYGLQQAEYRKPEEVSEYGDFIDNLGTVVAPIYPVLKASRASRSDTEASWYPIESFTFQKAEETVYTALKMVETRLASPEGDKAVLEGVATALRLLQGPSYGVQEALNEVAAMPAWRFVRSYVAKAYLKRLETEALAEKQRIKMRSLEVQATRIHRKRLEKKAKQEKRAHYIPIWMPGAGRVVKRLKDKGLIPKGETTDGQ